MKPEQYDRLEAGGDLSEPGKFSLGKLQPPEIVGQVDDPVLETMRRSWWQGFDRVCYCFVLIRLWIFDRIYGPEPPTPVDLQREADRAWLVRSFPAIGETIEPRKCRAGQNRDCEIGSHYR